MDNRERIAELAIKAKGNRDRPGSQEAFNELYRLTRDRAYFVALTITRNEQDALDITQDSYLKAWRHIDSLQKPEQFPAWLQRITGNIAKDFIKHHSPLLFLSSDDDTGNLFDLQEEKNCDYIPDAAMDTAETRRLIMNIVDELPEDQRLCTLMYYYDDMEMPEIAAALDIPLGTVKSRLHLARKKISLGVEDLERKGTKLYSASPIPLLIWLLRKTASETSANLPPVILGGVTAGAAVTGGVIAGVALPKIIAGIAAVAIIGGGAAAGAAVARQRAMPVKAETTITVPAEATAVNVPDIPQYLPLSDLLLVLPSASDNSQMNRSTAPATRPIAEPAVQTLPSTHMQGMASTAGTAPAHTTAHVSATTVPVTTTRYAYIGPSTTARSTTQAAMTSTTIATTTTTTTSTTTTTRASITNPPGSLAGEPVYDAVRIIYITLIKIGGYSMAAVNQDFFEFAYDYDPAGGFIDYANSLPPELIPKAIAIGSASNVLAPAQQAAWMDFCNAYGALIWSFYQAGPNGYEEGTSAYFEMLSPGLMDDLMEALYSDPTVLDLQIVRNLTARMDAVLRGLGLTRAYDDPTKP